MNLEGFEIGWFWPKSLGYSPWFWKWRIWVGVGIRSKLPKSPPMFLQMHFQVLSRMLVKISDEFRRAEIGWFWPKSLGYSPWFWTWRIWVSFGNRSKHPEKNPMCSQMDIQLLSRMLVRISYAFRSVRNRPVLDKFRESIQTPWKASDVLANGFPTTVENVGEDFGWIWKGSKIGWFWPKSLGYSPWFWTWRIWVSFGIRSKLPKSPPMCLQMHFQVLSRMFVKISDEFRRVRNWPILTKKPGL